MQAQHALAEADSARSSSGCSSDDDPSYAVSKAAAGTAAARIVLQALAVTQAGIVSMREALSRMPVGCHPLIFYQRVRPFLSGWKTNPTLPDGVLYEVPAWGRERGVRTLQTFEVCPVARCSFSIGESWSGGILAREGLLFPGRSTPPQPSVCGLRTSLSHRRCSMMSRAPFFSPSPRNPLPRNTMCLHPVGKLPGSQLEKTAISRRQRSAKHAFSCPRRRARGVSLGALFPRLLAGDEGLHAPG